MVRTSTASGQGLWLDRRNEEEKVSRRTVLPLVPSACFLSSAALFTAAARLSRDLTPGAAGFGQADGNGLRAACARASRARPCSALSSRTSPWRPSVQVGGTPRGRLQLLVGRLQLLDGGLQLLVRRLELLVGAFDDRSVALAREGADLRELIGAGRALEPFEARHEVESR